MCRRQSYTRIDVLARTRVSYYQKGKNWKEKLVVDAIVYSDASELGFGG